jgi:hypothetical protein
VNAPRRVIKVEYNRASGVRLPSIGRDRDVPPISHRHKGVKA